MSPVQCLFKAEHVIFTLRKTCIVQNQIIADENVELQFNKKKIRKDDGNTTAISFKECSIRVWPCFDPIVKLLPSLTSLTIKQCNLNKIEKENFAGLLCLKELVITGNKIICVPWDVFINTPNVEILSLKRNGIKYIDEDFLEPLKNLKYCDLSENVHINARFDGTKFHGSLGYSAFLAEIKLRCSIRVNDLMKEIEQSNGAANNRNKRSSVSESDPENHRRQLALHKEIDKLREQLRFWQNKCTDFTITVEDYDFKVHKSIIVGASPLLKKMIESSPDADNLILQDISVATFKTIYDFMYEKTWVDGELNIGVFAACHKLEMNEMANTAAKIIKRTITKDNAYEVLLVSNIYNNNELRAAAFKEFKKNFPDKKLTDDMAMKPDVLKKIMSAKIAMDEAFENLQVSDQPSTPI